jgi:outer membrane protein
MQRMPSDKTTNTTYSILLLLALLSTLFSFPVQASIDEGRATLLAVYQEALSNDAQLLAARHHYESLKEKVPQARAGLLPTLNSSVRSSAVTQEASSTSRSRTDSVFQANLIQPLLRTDRWFQLDAAQATVTKDQFELLAKEQLLILSVAQAYFETLRALDRVAATKAEETALQRQQLQAQGRLANGAANITDVLEAKAAHLGICLD